MGEHHAEWKQYFDQHHVNGCIEIYDLSHSKFIDYNEDRCAQRFIPASTFDICNSLIALESKTVPDTNYMLMPDSVLLQAPFLNHDESMNMAFHNSTSWYYREISRMIGREKMEQYLRLFHYGNMQTGKNIDSLPLDGSLKISCDEQIEFLKDLYTNQLPISKNTVNLVKGLMIIKKDSDWILSGKSGGGIMKDEAGTKTIGWFTGYIEKNGEVYFFATNIESAKSAQTDFADSPMEITVAILKQLHFR